MNYLDLFIPIWFVLLKKSSEALCLVYLDLVNTIQECHTAWNVFCILVKIPVRWVKWALICNVLRFQLGSLKTFMNYYEVGRIISTSLVYWTIFKLKSSVHVIFGLLETCLQGWPKSMFYPGRKASLSLVGLWYLANDLEHMIKGMKNSWKEKCGALNLLWSICGFVGWVLLIVVECWIYKVLFFPK